MTIAPPEARPYRIRRPRPYYAESLQLFKTRREAETARAAELVAADFSRKTESELKAGLQHDLDRVANFGITLATLCRITGESYNKMTDYISRGRSPNPRTVARFHMLAEEFSRVANSGKALLPASGGCGNPRKSRGGRPEIWMEQKRFSIISDKPVDTGKR